MHEEFQNHFNQFKESLENREETNFKYLRCRLDFNMYYQMKALQDMGGDGGDDADNGDMDDYGDDNDEIGFDDDDVADN